MSSISENMSRILGRLSIFFFLIIFTTTCKEIEPAHFMIVETGAVTNVSHNSCNVTGEFLDIGDGGVSQHGFCWAKTNDPSISSPDKIELGSKNSKGSFTSSITVLTPSTTYFIRAYGIDAKGVKYGAVKEFTTTSQLTIPTVSTSSISNEIQTTASGGGNVTDDGGSTITSRGVCWSTSENPTIADDKTSDGTGIGGYSSLLTGLICNTTYFVKAYATNSSGTAYGAQVSFSTSACSSEGVPTVITTSISNVTETTAQGGGNVTDDGGAPVTSKGICWSTSQNPSTTDNKTTDGTGTGVFTSAMADLGCGATYYVRAYATNSSGTGYGNQEEFTTTGCPVNLATITTASISNITEISAQGGGDVTSDGGASVTSKGICWSTSQNPTKDDFNSIDGNGTGSFSSLITGLICGTAYYVRAFAINTAGTAYGDQVSFTTAGCVVSPAVTTTSISNIGASSAQGGGNVTSDGGATVTARGVCWSTSSNPTTSDFTSSNGTGIGSYTSNLTGLNPLTTYYVRAYATNNAGTEYGSQVSFTTLWDNSPVTDYDGNTYGTRQIGNQIWMGENLQVTHYADGTSISLVTGTTAWSNLGSTGKGYCWYNNNESSYSNPYGALYTWAAATNGSSSSSNPSGLQGVCPSGWHLPSDDEWKEMEKYLGMSQIQVEGIDFRGTDEGGKLKETQTEHWSSPNTGATNSTGFTGLPGGGRYENSFNDLGATGYHWTATSFDTNRAWYRGLGYSSALVHRFYYQKNDGFSVRCVKD